MVSMPSCLTYASVLFDLDVEVVDADALEAMVEVHTLDKVG